MSSSHCPSQAVEAQCHTRCLLSGSSLTEGLKDVPDLSSSLGSWSDPEKSSYPVPSKRHRLLLRWGGGGWGQMALGPAGGLNCSMPTLGPARPEPTALPISAPTPAQVIKFPINMTRATGTFLPCDLPRSGHGSPGDTFRYC